MTLIVHCGKHGVHETVELLCRPANFMHLTGAKTKLPAKVFYDRAVSGSLSEKDFDVGSVHGIEKKLFALSHIVGLHKCHSMIGDYNNSRTHLTADKVIGTGKCCLALKRDDKRGCFVPAGIHVPVSALQDNIAALTSKPARILAVFQKGCADKEYASITYIAHKTDITQLRPPQESAQQIAGAVADFVENRSQIFGIE